MVLKENNLITLSDAQITVSLPNTINCAKCGHVFVDFRNGGSLIVKGPIRFVCPTPSCREILEDGIPTRD